MSHRASPLAGRLPRRRVAGLSDPFAELEATPYAGLALTVYLAAAIGGYYDAGFHAIQLRELARRAQPGLGEAELAALQRELPEAVDYLGAARPPPHLALAVFSSRPAGLLEGWRFRGEVEPQLRVARWLELEPLRQQLRAHPPALVLVADKEKARAFSAVLDRVQELIETGGDKIHVQRQGGASALNWQHKEAGRARRNLEQLTRWLERADDSFIERVSLAGPEEARAELRRRLPHRYLMKLAGELQVPMYESAGTTAERIRAFLAGAGQASG